jgi:hypothetical protein
MRLERLGKLKKLNYLIATRTRDHPAGSIVPLPSMLPHALYVTNMYIKKVMACFQLGVHCVHGAMTRKEK